jgi:hypothetical protein
MSSDSYHDVSTMYESFGLAGPGGPARLSNKKINERIDFLQEELDELREAVMNCSLADQVDALLDLKVVADGTLRLMLGGDPTLYYALWDDVHRANCSKQVGAGRHHGFREGADLIKPPGWVPPDGGAILARYGYDAASESETPGELRAPPAPSVLE